MKPVIAITVGDINGIGPEVALKCVRSRSLQDRCTPVLIGPRSAFAYYAAKLKIPVRFRPVDPEELRLARKPAGSRMVPIIEPDPGDSPDVTPGKLTEAGGRIAARAIELAARLALSQRVDAVVTAPVSKQALHLAGVPFPGHTEMLQHLTSSPRVAMMLVSRTLRVGLATIHLPLARVSDALTADVLRHCIEVVHEALRVDWRIDSPSIAVLGLNPHAGEGGDIGTEEARVIIPVMKELCASGLPLEGPFPADSFFGLYAPGRYDAVIAMYHDQGLIPLKMKAFRTAVNVTAGLPIVRTSPDHGTAFPIAGTGRADHRSMAEAIALACRIARNRHRADGGPTP